MILIGLVIIAVLIVCAVPQIRRKPTTMTALTPRDVEAADRLALARLDDDGAPPAPTPPKASDTHDLHALRQGHPGRVGATRAEPGTTARGEGARTPVPPGTS
jgi:hypothetical protein